MDRGGRVHGGPRSSRVRDEMGRASKGCARETGKRGEKSLARVQKDEILKSLLRPLYRYQLMELNTIIEPPSEESMKEAKEKLGDEYPPDGPVETPKESFENETEQKSFEKRLAKLASKKQVRDYDPVDDDTEEEEEEEEEVEDEKLDSAEAEALREKKRLAKLLKEHQEKEKREKQERQKLLVEQQRKLMPKKTRANSRKAKSLSGAIKEVDAKMETNALVNAVKSELTAKRWRRRRRQAFSKAFLATRPTTRMKKNTRQRIFPR